MSLWIEITGYFRDCWSVHRSHLEMPIKTMVEFLAARHMNIYLICPVRDTTFDSSEYVTKWESEGHDVHFPPRDVDQNDPIGLQICSDHLAAMRKADEVWVIWDVSSKGSHFDLGMAFALGKRVRLIKSLYPDTPGKSYQKVIETVSE